MIRKVVPTKGACKNSRKYGRILPIGCPERPKSVSKRLSSCGENDRETIKDDRELLA